MKMLKVENAAKENSDNDVVGVTDPDEAEEAQPEVDIVINNVVCSFNVRCHLNLRDIALRAMNVEYRKENGMVTMKLRQPYTTASIWSSGKITCTGANSEEQARIAARRFARVLQKLGFNTRFCNFRVVNVLGTCNLPFAIKITQFSQANKPLASYEPELHPGVTYKLRECKATLKIFSTGSITVTAPSVSNVRAAIEHIYPLVHEFRKAKAPTDQSDNHHSKLKKSVYPIKGRKRKRTASGASQSSFEEEGAEHSGFNEHHSQSTHNTLKHSHFE